VTVVFYKVLQLMQFTNMPYGASWFITQTRGFIGWGQACYLFLPIISCVSTCSVYHCATYWWVAQLTGI